jgi:hypothetical protein
VATDHAGNLLVADGGNQVQAVAGSTGTFYGQAMTAGHLYTVITPQLGGDLAPAAIAVDTAGNLLLAESESSLIGVYAVTTGEFYGQAMTAGDIYVVAGNGVPGNSGNGGPATAAELLGPEGLALDSAGNLVIADTANEEIRVVAETTGTFYGQAMTAGDIYTVAGGGSGGTASGIPATSATLGHPAGLAIDAAGNLAFGDDAKGSAWIRVVAAAAGTFYGQAMTAGRIYTVAGTGADGFSGDGGPASAAELSGPFDVAVNGAGDLLIADFSNGRVRQVAG